MVMLWYVGAHGAAVHDQTQAAACVVGPLPGGIRAARAEITDQQHQGSSLRGVLVYKAKCRFTSTDLVRGSGFGYSG